MKELARKNILSLMPYIAGKPIEEVKRELGLKKVIKLASNENPLGASPKALSALKKNLDKINRYPDSGGFYLKKRLAKYHGVYPTNIILGNGSDEIIDIVIKAFIEDDENIVTAETTFLEYEIIAKVNNRKIITVPLKYFKYDLEAIRNKINNKTKAVFIANPNNPTGTYVTKDELDDFIGGLPEGVALVLDEAYDAFIDAPDFVSGLNYFKRNNVIVMKTFSKAYGLAGLRIGYAIAESHLTGAMEKVRQPFNVNLLAQTAAIAALEDKKFLFKTRKAVIEGKNYLNDALKKMGVIYVDSAANFILIELGVNGAAVFKKMLQNGVIVRDMQQYGLENFIRVTVGTQRENQRFIKVLKKVLS